MTVMQTLQTQQTAFSGFPYRSLSIGKTQKQTLLCLQRPHNGSPEPVKHAVAGYGKGRGQYERKINMNVVEDKDIETARRILKKELPLLKKRVADGHLLRPSERKYLLQIANSEEADDRREENRQDPQERLRQYLKKHMWNKRAQQTGTIDHEH